jgi:hypothetical protein
MTLIEVAVECPVFDSFRVQQVAGLFDTPLAERAKSSFAVDVPTLDEDWLIGLIVGPSGSGKSTIARQAFSPWLATPKPWPAEQAVIDGRRHGSSRMRCSAAENAFVAIWPELWRFQVGQAPACRRSAPNLAKRKRRSCGRK